MKQIMIKGQPHHFEEIELTYENANIMVSAIRQELVEFLDIEPTLAEH